MVLISSKKYACETCIKGHRSSACKHTDRPLFEIKKKGRPVTQCEHCRELRKRKQVHVKCICMTKEDAGVPTSSTAKKGLSKTLETAAFPNGLPEVLEASVIHQAPSDGVSSDSDHSGDSCACASGAVSVDELCACATPRKSAPRRRPKVDTETRASTSPHPPETPSINSSHILARIAELRPVLPKPPAINGPVHVPSAGINHVSAIRHHGHDTSFSPYGRAYGQVHMSSRPSSPLANDMYSAIPSSSNVPINQTQAFNNVLWSQSQNAETAMEFPMSSMCGCGDNCGCPGCSQHDPSGDRAAYNFFSCSNPSACGACLDCLVQSLPSFPQASPTETQDPTSTLDEWMRQFNAGTSFDEMAQSVPWMTQDRPRLCPIDNGCLPGSCQCDMARDGSSAALTTTCEKGCRRKELSNGLPSLFDYPPPAMPLGFGTQVQGDGSLTLPGLARSRSSSMSSRSSSPGGASPGGRISCCGGLSGRRSSPDVGTGQ
ncbi:uncharacterized protein BT62DRAFT_973238 [Guyanagaster necrorhizus]|uniref:Copper-fist domain-containing protein n=1 Tax=Guyanagaster necrorhizus TaxID=856835 RepID=A0A9P8AP29_9AGAR|nr:uncharacterized protein BT62DRAFT_973238 [Guyanagaster necrorhizus MCA 3950]KAG7442908.1 hypothetical protein BT62DRAFT_973238 [Guyanagaster necrorhizus MCA 3950]